MINILIPNNFVNERKYIYELLLKDFLGLKYELIYDASLSKNIRIECNDKVLEIADVFFADESIWLTEHMMPDLPLEKINSTECFLDCIREKELSVIYGKRNNEGRYFRKDEHYMYIGIDIFGSSFFMLSRYEEYVNKERDSHDRFQAKDSVAFKEGFLDRPIINEYIEILWSGLKWLNPELKRKERKYRVLSTHDIDHPFGMMYESFSQVARHFAGDILIRKSIRESFNRAAVVCKLLFNRKNYISEKKGTFSFIFKQSKKHDLQDVFFFMNSKKSWIDGNYTVDEPEVVQLIKEIYNAGHLVGLHPSYISYNHPTEIADEVKVLNTVLTNAGLPALAGARQHYLRWANPVTWQLYEKAGIPFDSTMSFADYAGFRSGICYAYPVYDIINRKKLNLLEYPLIVMEGTLFEYMKLSFEDAMTEVLRLSDRCRKYNGDFVILWHNTTLDNFEHRKFYDRMLNMVCK